MEGLWGCWFHVNSKTQIVDIGLQIIKKLVRWRGTLSYGVCSRHLTVKANIKSQRLYKNLERYP